MSRGVEKLLELLLKSESSWATVPASVRRSEILSQVMSILPDGPLLKIEYKDPATNEVAVDMTLTLEQVDYQIGELIKMRDMLAAIKGDDPR